MRIAVIPNLEKKNIIDVTIDVINKLIFFGCNVVMPLRCKKIFHIKNLEFYDNIYVASKCDIGVVIGGDGSIIRETKIFALYNVPVLGINLGRIGFVAELEPNELCYLEYLAKNKYKVEKRMLFDVSVSQQNIKMKNLYSLNDVVLSKGSSSNMIDLEIKCNDTLLSNYRADGVIISTPTGSTAYSLSSGGPVIDPIMRCSLITPICAHSLFSRSILLSDNTSISISPSKNFNFSETYLSIDGEKHIELKNGFCVTVKASQKEAYLVKIKNDGFYKVLNNKLSKRTF